MPASLVLSAPHSYCPRSPAGVRRCDLRSAQALHALLLAAGDRAVSLSADAPRERGDLNRSETRHTPWRKKLRRILDATINANIHTTQQVVALDVHSHPKYGNSGRPPWGKVCAIAVMHYDTNPASYALATRLAAAATRSVHGTVLLLQGSPVNDIMGDAAARGVPTALIEFSEDRGVLTDAELVRAARAIADVALGG